MGIGLLVAVLLGVVGRHREIFLPLSISATIRLDPLLPLAFVTAGAALITPRRFTLEPRNLREREVRLSSVAAFSIAAGLGMAVVSAPRVGEFLLLSRNFIALLGLLLLLGTVADTRLALLALSTVTLLYAYAGSYPAGEPKTWAWLLHEEPTGRAWAVAVTLLIVGSVLDAVR